MPGMPITRHIPPTASCVAALLQDAREATEFSTNHTSAKPDIDSTEKEHILGLCRVVMRLVEHIEACPIAAAPLDAIAGVLAELSTVAARWTAEAAEAGADARNECAAQMQEAIKQQSINFGLFDASVAEAQWIDRKQLRRLANSWIVEATSAAAEAKRSCADELLAALDTTGATTGTSSTCKPREGAA